MAVLPRCVHPGSRCPLGLPAHVGSRGKQVFLRLRENLRCCQQPPTSRGKLQRVTAMAEERGQCPRRTSAWPVCGRSSARTLPTVLLCAPASQAWRPEAGSWKSRHQAAAYIKITTLRPGRELSCRAASSALKRADLRCGCWAGRLLSWAQSCDDPPPPPDSRGEKTFQRVFGRSLVLASGC